MAKKEPFLQAEEGARRVMPVVSGSPWAPPQASDVSARPELLAPPLMTWTT